MDDDFEFNEHDFSYSGDSELSDLSSSEVYQETLADDSDSDNSVDYSCYFEDIIIDLESLIGFYDENVTLSDIHKDLTISNFLIIFFIVLFSGNKLINKIRGLWYARSC